jgi:hypothetical protein
MKAPAHREQRAGAGQHSEQLALLPEPEFSPIWPKRTTLPGRALALMLQGEAITHPQFEDITGSWRLSEPVRALRHDFGWPVASTEIPCPTPENPDRVIARYFLPPEVLEQAGVRHG